MKSSRIIPVLAGLSLHSPSVEAADPSQESHEYREFLHTLPSYQSGFTSLATDFRRHLDELKVLRERIESAQNLKIQLEQDLTKLRSRFVLIPLVSQVPRETFAKEQELADLNKKIDALKVQFTELLNKDRDAPSACFTYSYPIIGGDERFSYLPTGERELVSALIASDTNTTTWPTAEGTKTWRLDSFPSNRITVSTCDIDDLTISGSAWVIRLLEVSGLIYKIPVFEEPNNRRSDQDILKDFIKLADSDQHLETLVDLAREYLEYLDH